MKFYEIKFKTSFRKLSMEAHLPAHAPKIPARMVMTHPQQTHKQMQIAIETPQHFLLPVVPEGDCR